MTNLSARTVIKISVCDLAREETDWAFAKLRQAEIESHWQRRIAENPSFFNGRIHLLSSFRLDSSAFHGTVFETSFKDFLYWSETAPSDPDVFDAFGSALLRSREGHIILGRQRAGNINSGLSYLPGGFIDTRDVTADNTIDIDGSIAREIAEETGLVPDQLKRLPGYYITCNGQQISIAAEYTSDQSADELAARIRAHIASEAEPELEDVAVVTSRNDLSSLIIPDFAHILLSQLLA